MLVKLLLFHVHYPLLLHSYNFIKLLWQEKEKREMKIDMDINM